MPLAEEHAIDQFLVAEFKHEASRESAFTKIVKKYQERLYWHIRKMVVSHDDTDDILQNVFIKVWRNLNEFRQDSALYTWLYRIATNETLTWLEQKKRRQSVTPTQDIDLISDSLVAQKDFDPSKIEWKLQLAMAQLPDKQKLVFNLRYYDEMPYDEMSEILETSVGALKASYHHAVKKIEQFLTNN